MESIKYKIFFGEKEIGEVSGSLIDNSFNGLEIEGLNGKIKGPEDFENALMNKKSTLRNSLAAATEEAIKVNLNTEIAELDLLHEAFKKALLPEASENENEPESEEVTKEEVFPVYDFRGAEIEKVTSAVLETRPNKDKYKPVYNDKEKIVSYLKLPRFVYYVGLTPGQVVIEGENITNEAEAFAALQEVKFSSFIKKTQDVGLQFVD